MGKRLPRSKKHKKLKFVDPYYRGERNLPRRKALPNEPPTEKDGLADSHKEEEFFNIKNNGKKAKFKRKKKKNKVMEDEFIIVKRGANDKDNDDAEDKSKQLPAVKQKKNESEAQFFNRLQRAANAAMAEAKIETKYNIKLVNIDKQGNAKYLAPPKEVSERKREIRKKYKEKDLEKKKIKREDSEKDLKRENIKFGEVVTAPPIFTAKPRKAPEKDKPGKKNLALKEIFSSSSETGKAQTQGPVAIKWKNLTSEKRKTIENERHRVIEMYRILKQKKNEIT